MMSRTPDILRDPSPAPPAWRVTGVRVFLTCWMVYALHFATNVVREAYPAMSLGDHGTFNVFEYLGLHPDIFQPDASRPRAYINNNPGASIVGAIPYLVARPVIDAVVARVLKHRAEQPASQPAVYDTKWPLAKEFYEKTRARGLDVKFGLAVAVMQALAMAPLSALAVVVMFRVLYARLGRIGAALWLAMLFGFATPVFYRTATLNQNLLVAHAALLAFAILWRPWDEPTHPRRPAYFRAGLLMGFGVLCDYSGLVVAGVLAVYAWARRRSLPFAERRHIDLPILWSGAAVGVGALWVYQWVCFGHPFRPAQAYMPTTTFSHLGYSGFDRPHLDLVWKTLFERHYGLISAAPILGLALWPAAWRDGRALVGRRERWCIAAMAVGFLIFCACNQFTRMQFNTGVRHVVPVVPFVFLIAAGALARIPRSAAIAFGVTATSWSLCLAMERDVELHGGIVGCIGAVFRDGPRLPWLKTVELMHIALPGGTVASSLLVIGLAALLIWIVWRPQIKALRQMKP